MPKKDIATNKTTRQGIKIKILLLETGITQSALAERFAVSQAFISQVISGKSKSYPIQKAISKILKVPFEELWSNNISP